MSTRVRLVMVVVASWLVAACLSWLALSAPEGLVGGRARSDLSSESVIAGRLDLSEAVAVLEKVPVWGVGRDGKPLGAEQSVAKEEKSPMVWQIVAAVVRPDDRYVVVAIKDEAARRIVRMGGALPDGSIVVDIEPKRVVLKHQEDTESPSIVSF